MAEEKHYVLLEIPPTTRPIRLLVQDIGRLSSLTPDGRENRRFRFEENTHPINVLTEVVYCQPEVDFKVVELFDTQDEGVKRLYELLEEDQ